MKNLFTLLLVLVALFSNAQEKAARIDSLMNAAFNAGTFNGNVLVAEKGNVIYEKSFGYANEQTKEKLNAESIFELASVSKQFTAMAVVLLQKQGKLSYEDKIAKFIPELAFYGDISIRNLLNHTGGLPDYMELFEKSWDKTKFATNKDIVDQFAAHKPAALFAPNEKYEYSNTGYALLGLLIERLSGKSFGDFLEKQIFQPLKMKNTFVYRSRFAPTKVSNYANGYIADTTGQKVLPDSFGKEYYSYYLDGIVGDGMVNSTVHDLLTWDRALYSNALVERSDKDLIFKRATTADGKVTSYGFGWQISDSDKYGKSAAHSGGWAGYVTYIERLLDHDKTIILLQNNMLGTTKIPAKEIRKILYGEGLAQPVLTKTEVSAADLQKYAGVYSHPAFPLKITIASSGNTLTAQATGQSAFPMAAYANHTFTFDQANIKMIFVPSENAMLFSQGGNELKFMRE
ncbi:MAG TPA: serine hydrolase domain-containing protein [Flavobacterium sp.]|jgi:CubicO group peptidase (beta-lactamase class C family)